MSIFVLLSLISCGFSEGKFVATDPVNPVGPQGQNITFFNSITPEPNLILGGQPSESELTSLAEAGYKTVISLRGQGESSGFDEPSVLEGLGLAFRPIPIGGPADLTFANAARMRAILDDTSAWPIVVHCASGNRVGALFAIDAAASGLSTEEAITKGRAYGMTSLSSTVNQMLSD